MQTLSGEFHNGRANDRDQRTSKQSPTGNFVIYLPQDEAVAAGLGTEDGALDPVESQHVVDLLNKELSRLLKLGPKEFWREVAHDESLTAFLESFLKFRKRWYDFPYRGTRGIVAGVVVGEFELSRRVFMVLYRISSNRDPGAKAADTLSAKDHTAILQERKLLDLPKLLDICAIYGHENEELTRILVNNAIKAQPYIQNDFPVLISQFLSIVQTMHRRCNSTLEVLLNSAGHQDKGPTRLHLDYLEVMDFINDAVQSMDSFVNAYKHAALSFSSVVEPSSGDEDLLITLARLHDSLLPSLYKAFHIILGNVEDGNSKTSSDLLPNISISLKMLSTRIERFGWRLLYFCYLSDEVFESSYHIPASLKIFPANVEDPSVRADILIQSIKDLSGDHMYDRGVQIWGTFIRNIEKKHQMMNRIKLLQETGWISMDDEQFQFLCGITSNHSQSSINAEKPLSLATTSNTVLQSDEDSAMLESKISQIRELFPEYGRGFLVACLEAYNQDSEEVIQRILEGTLHQELQSLDISMENTPPPKSASLASKSDKGKGKLVESEIPLSQLEPPTLIEPKPRPASSSSSSSSATIGRFVRKNADRSADSGTLNAPDKKEKAKISMLASQLEYEDEYDDSFDDLGLSVGDSGIEESEALDDNTYKGRAPIHQHQHNDNSSASTADKGSKWNSRSKPRFFVKDGKNYAYKVDGSVAVNNANEAKLLNMTQKGLIHGLGRGGNIPLSSANMINEMNDLQNDGEDSKEIAEGRGHVVRGRGVRGKGNARNYRSDDNNINNSYNNNNNDNSSRFVEGSKEREETRDDVEGGGRRGRGGGNHRGRGRRGRGSNIWKQRALTFTDH